MYQHFFHYYLAYGPMLAIISVCLTLLYWTLANWGTLRAMHRCSNFKRTVTGQLPKCFTSRQGDTCQSTDLGHIYGWCHDPENYGALPGTSTGPYIGQCNQWIWSHDQCPPSQCNGVYPKGIDGQCDRKWGWCADKGVERAMLGAPCGPKGDTCTNWIWNAKKCPTGCEKPKKKCEEDGPAEDGECKDNCVCEGPPKDPWKPYINKKVEIKHGKCRLQSGSGKRAEFLCKDREIDKQGTMFIEYTQNDGSKREGSSGSTFKIYNSHGCALSYTGSGRKRHAVFNCNRGKPVVIEGTPDDARIYAMIDGEKYGLRRQSGRAMYEHNKGSHKFIVNMTYR